MDDFEDFEKQELIKQFQSWPLSLRILVVAVGLCLVWLFLGMLPLLYYGEAAKSGPFGDTFGISNSFFAVLTLIVVLFSSYEQRKTNLKTIEIAERAESAPLLNDLVLHIRSYSKAFYRSSSNTRRYDEASRNYLASDSPKLKAAYAEQLKEREEEGVRALAHIRRAAAALEADELRLKMIFKKNAKPLIAVIFELRLTSNVFENPIDDWYKQCFKVEQRIRSDVEKAIRQVSAFWETLA